jgi:hypothetical protein
VLLDEDAAAMLDEQTGELDQRHVDGLRNTDKSRNIYGGFKGTDKEMAHLAILIVAAHPASTTSPSPREKNATTARTA